MPLKAPAVLTLRPVLVRPNVPLALPIAVFAEPVVLILVAPKTLVVEALLPMATVPVEVPVLMLVLKFELLLREIAAPEMIAPPEMVARPEAFKVEIPLSAPPVVTVKALEVRAKVPVLLPIAVLAVPVVLMLVVPSTVAPPLAVKA